MLFKEFAVYIKKANSKKLDSDDDLMISGNIMLIGAGSAGEIIINEMLHKREYSRCKIKCVIDDDHYKQGQYISGIKIVGGRNKILEYAERYDISVIIFAISEDLMLTPSATTTM